MNPIDLYKVRFGDKYPFIFDTDCGLLKMTRHEFKIHLMQCLQADHQYDIEERKQLDMEPQL